MKTAREKKCTREKYSKIIPEKKIQNSTRENSKSTREKIAKKYGKEDETAIFLRSRNVTSVISDQNFSSGRMNMVLFCRTITNLTYGPPAFLPIRRDGRKDISQGNFC